MFASTTVNCFHESSVNLDNAILGRSSSIQPAENGSEYEDGSPDDMEVQKTVEVEMTATKLEAHDDA